MSQEKYIGMDVHQAFDSALPITRDSVQEFRVTTSNYWSKLTVQRYG